MLTPEHAEPRMTLAEDLITVADKDEFLNIITVSAAKKCSEKKMIHKRREH
jgi:hypothetical protein